MPNPFTLITSIAKLWSSFMTWLNNKRQQELGAKEKTLENIEHADKISADIADDRSNPKLRKSTRKKYTRKEL